MQPIYEFGGQGRVMNLALANGFPPATYRPLMEGFTQDHRVISLLPRPFWEGEQPPTALLDWSAFLTRDLTDGFREHDLTDVIAVGHSFGGIATLLSVLENPQRFKALILLDPTIFSHEIIQALETMSANNAMDQFHLAARALRRQHTFSSTEEAFRYFRSRPLFADWSDEAVRHYAEGGTIPTENGVKLSWSPEWESYYFKTGYTKIWKDLPRLRGLLPTLIIRGANSDTYLPEAAREVREILPEATHVEVEGHGHLFPMSNPAETYRIMREWIDRL
jgi:pimeloyl-ACP methyl ester carboxylesterase